MLPETPKPPPAGDGLSRKAISTEVDSPQADLIEAERLFEAGKFEESLQLAEKALTAFLEQSDATGIANSKRLIIHNFRCQEENKFAAQIAKEEQLLFHEKGDTSGAAKMSLCLAELALARDEDEALQEAESLAKQATHDFKELGDPTFEGLALLTLASIALKRGAEGVPAQARAAQECACEALECFQDEEDHRGLGRSLLCLAETHAALQNYCEVSRAAEKAVEVFRFCGDGQWQAFAMQRKAFWHLEAGNPKMAVECCETVLALVQQKACSESCEFQIATILSSAQILLGQPDEALSVVRSCLRKARAMGDSNTEGRMLHFALQLNHAMGDLESAFKCAGKAEEIFEQLEDRRMVLAVMRSKCSLQMAAGASNSAMMSEAVNTAKKALAIADEFDIGAEEMGLCWLQMAEVRAARDETTNALSAADRASNAFQESRKSRQQAKAILVTAEISIKKQDYDSAGSLSFQAQKIYNGVGDLKGEADALVVLASVQAYREEHSKAIRAAERACELFRQTGDRRAEANTLILMSQCGQQHYLASAGQGVDGFFPAYGPALRAATEAAALAQELNDVQLMASSLLALAQVQVADKQQLADALQNAIEASDLWSQMGHAAGMGSSLDVQAHALHKMGRKQDAVQAMKKAQQVYQQAGMPGSSSRCESFLREWGATQAPKKVPTNDDEQPSDTQDIYQPPMQVQKIKREPKEVKDLSKLQGEELVAAQVAQIVDDLGLEDIELDAGLMTIGLTSRSAIQLRAELQEKFGAAVKIPATMAFDFPSVRQISSYLHEEVQRVAAG